MRTLIAVTPRLYRTGEVARMLGLRPELIKKWAAADLIPHRRAPSGKNYFSPEDVASIRRGLDTGVWPHAEREE